MPELLGEHPYRGAIFENFILNELLKQRFNQGQRSNMYFWRESSGKEIDVLIDEGLHINPVEVKSGYTITTDWLKGLKYWNTLQSTERGGTVYYAGDEMQERTGGFQVRSWRALSSKG